MHNGKYQCRKLHIPPTNYHNNNKSIFKAQNLVPRDYSKCIHTHPHTSTPTHKHSDYTKQQMPGRLGMDKDARNRKIWQVCNFGKRNVFRLDLNESRGFCWKGRGRSFHADGPKTEKVQNQQSGARNLEAESIRSGAESMGGHVKLKTVTEIRRSSARDTFIAESVYLVLNSLLDWKPVEKLKQRCYVVSFTFFQYEISSTVLYVTKALDRGSKQARKERTAVVKVQQHEWGDQFHLLVVQQEPYKKA